MTDTKRRQIIESVTREPDVTEAEAEQILEAIYAGNRLKYRLGTGYREVCMTAFTHPLENCPAWAVEVWAGENSWKRVYFAEYQADRFYDGEIVRLKI